MKLKIFSLGLLVLLAASCKKQLVQAPSNALPLANAFKTVSDFDAAAKGMYYEMVHSNNYLSGEDNPIAWASTLDILADNVITQQTGRGSQRTFGNWQYNKSNTTFMFEQAYTIIRSANAIVENIKNIDGTPQQSNYMGEALTVRAMVHFDLLRVYSKPVSGPQADLNALGVPYVTTTDIADKPNRGTVQATYTNVVADLVKAVDLINDDNGEGRLNKAAVYALLSRVYLYGGDWQKCIDASTACLAVNSDPASIGAFPGIWTDSLDNGVIFKIKVSEQDLDGGQPVKIGVGYNQQGPDGGLKSEWVCAYSFFKMFDSTDVRTASYLTLTTSNGINYNAIIKYQGRPNGGTLDLVDIKYLRVAEVLLNRAEAYTMIPNDVSALADLDALRMNRYSNFTPGAEAGQALKDAVDKERRLELAFEGDRWFTLKRKGLPVSRDAFGDYADGTGTPYFVTSLPAGDNKWQIPLYIGYINGNTNLVQNPGF
jgi:hypothetical protein